MTDMMKDNLCIKCALLKKVDKDGYITCPCFTNKQARAEGGGIIMMNDIYNTTADRLRAALSAEWCDLYGHKSEWSAAVSKAWDEEQKAFKAANDADEAGEEEGKVDALYDIAQALAEDRNKAEDRAERLEKAMELIEQLETLYSDDWKEV